MTTCIPPNHQMASTFTLKDCAGSPDDYVQSSFHQAFPKYSNVMHLKSKSFRPKVSALRSTVPIYWSTGAENESIFSAARPEETHQEDKSRHTVDDPASNYHDIRCTGLLVRDPDVEEKQSQYRQEFCPKFRVPDRIVAPKQVPLWTESAFTDKSVYRSDYQPTHLLPKSLRIQEGKKNLLVRPDDAFEGDVRCPLGEETANAGSAPETALPSLECSTTYKETFKEHSNSYTSEIIRGRKMTYPERSKKSVEIGTRGLVNELTRGGEATSYNTTFSAPLNLTGLAAAGLRSPGVSGQGGRYNPNFISTGSVTPTSFSKPEYCFRRRKHNIEGRIRSVEMATPARSAILPDLNMTLGEKMRNFNVWPYLEHRGGCFYKAH
ncbi:unnamed protein product [Schistocephalus solidus]|uniref:Stabilizer of axonemal microtubules 2 n=1 Tax=Schistocephalus solidus TaxID=70667 RepID=A0A183T451_SCHSO|nr:unnamed protein product [Schistocephalus solidus]